MDSTPRAPFGDDSPQAVRGPSGAIDPRVDSPADPRSGPDHDRPQPFVDGVLVVGAGYAGMAAARAVERRGQRATVVDAAARHDFTTRLAAVAGGTQQVLSASVRLSELDMRVIEDEVVGVRDGSVQLSDGSLLHADAVVMTVGSRPADVPIAGLDLAYDLRTAADADVLRSAISEIRSPGRLVIVGAGASGVQLAGAAAQAHPELAVTVVEMDDRVLPGMRERTSRHAQRILTERGVEVMVDTTVAHIDADGVTLSDGRRVLGTVVWAGGFEAHADAYGAKLTTDGRVVLAPDLRVLGTNRTFAAGDVAAHTDRHGDELAMSAQVAERAGRRAGINAARLVRGQPLDRVELRQFGWVLDLGGRRGVAEFGPIVLAGPLIDRVPPLLHWMIDLKHAISVGRWSAWSLRPH